MAEDEKGEEILAEVTEVSLAGQTENVIVERLSYWKIKEKVID